MKQVDANENNSEQPTTFDSRTTESEAVTTFDEGGGSTVVAARSATTFGQMNQQQQQQQQQQQRHQRFTTYNRLIDACKLKNLESIKAILRERPELVNQKDKHQRSLLHYTVILFNTTTSEIQQQQINNRLTREDHLGIECLNYLTDRCDLKLWWQQDLDGLTILHLAVISSNVPLVKYIVYEHQYSIKYPLVCTLDNELHSPLHWAVITNNLDCVQLLIGFAGTKLAHEPDLNGATPLHYATQTSDYPKYRQQLRLMLRNVVQDSTTTCGPQNKRVDSSDASRELQQQQQQEPPTRLLLAADHQRGLEILEYLVRLPKINLECMDKDRRTPLLWAASSGNRDAIMLLMSNGANSNSFDLNRLSALHCAASHGYTECLECLLGFVATTNTNRSSGCDSEQVNQPDNLNCTPLFYAILSGNIDCVETLLDRGAQADWQDAKGRTVAHFAALKGQLNSLKLLHERSANLWLPNKQGDLPLHYAIKSGRQQVVKWLLEHSPYERAVNAINNFGRAPIHLAIQKDNLKMVDYLIECGANLNQLVKIRDKNNNNNNNLVGITNKSSKEVDEEVDPSTIAHFQVGGKSGGGRYHYETALDMARNLNHKECLKLLIENQALPAGQVIQNRAASGQPVVNVQSSPQQQQQQQQQQAPQNVRSLFDLQSVEGISPIGFETSCSSISPSFASRQPHTQATTSALSDTPCNSSRQQVIPKLARPTPESLAQTDSSTGSSALSQNSMTSQHDVNQTPPIMNPQRQSIGRAGKQKPYLGGISYNNEHINASIKCKIYNTDRSGSSGQQGYQHQQRAHANYKSFPQAPSSSIEHQHASSHGPRSAPVFVSGSTTGKGSRQQEIITNVNVFTSPCPHCVHHQCFQCQQQQQQLTSRSMDGTNQSQQQQQSRLGKSDFQNSDETSDATSESGDDEIGDHLPDLTTTTSTSKTIVPVQCFGGEKDCKKHTIISGLPTTRHLPPSQAHEQHLPVILSDQERSISGASNERSPQAGEGEDDDDELVKQQQQQQVSTHRSATLSDQEPRFDRSLRARRAHRISDKYRDQVRSPVADYIYGNQLPGFQQQQQQQQQFVDVVERPVSLSRAMDRNRQHHRAIYHRSPDYSQVKAKVDSHRNAHEAATTTTTTTTHAGYGEEDYDESDVEDEHQRTKSMSTLPSTYQQQQQHSRFHHHAAADLRSVSRQTIIKTRRLSVDSVELASKVEKSIRKYKQETKLFEELQNLKRSQIRSGRANEALLVKRLVEHFRQDPLVDLIGLDNYTGPYTYKSYERFLYDQLRKLSQSNCAKLGKHFLRHLAETTPSHTDHDHDYHHQQHDDDGDDDDDDDHMKAHMEHLKRMIDASIDQRTADDSDFESYILEPSGALEEIRVKGRGPDLEDSSMRTLNERLKDSSKSETVQREWIHRSRDDDAGDELSKQQQSDKMISKPKTEEEEEEEEKLVENFNGAPASTEIEMEKKDTSSISSSRRSSIEVEREKMLNLPLRIGDDDDAIAIATATATATATAIGTTDNKNNIEEQANSLSSSILVDALGNVSRVGSRTSSPAPSKAASSDEEGGEDDQEAAASSVTATSNMDNSSMATRAESRYAGRRRSVVNIGNKMEVIYHNVGIEINPAADLPDTVEDDNAMETTTKPQSTPSAEFTKKTIDKEEKKKNDDDDDRVRGVETRTIEKGITSEKLENVEELEELVDKNSSSSSLSSIELIGDEDERKKSSMASPEETEIKQVAGGKEEEEEETELGGVEISKQKEPTARIPLVATTKPPTSSRRSSSPLTMATTTTTSRQTMVTSTTMADGRSRRAYSIGRPETLYSGASEAPTKKVFTGYDLDEMHRAHLKRLSSPSLLLEQPDKDQRQQQQQQQQQQTTTTTTSISEKVCKCKVTPTKRRRTPTQPPPKGAYRLRVPIKEVKQRWAPIKKAERRRKQAYDADGSVYFNSSLGVPSTIGGGGGGDIKATSSMTKSQPNLRIQKQASQRGEEEKDEQPTIQTQPKQEPNYILIYEINKGREHQYHQWTTSGEEQAEHHVSSRGAGEPIKKDADKSGATWWCHRRAAKIVDVRTLKRTISLPDALIYSNDLLKKFNILKL